MASAALAARTQPAASPMTIGHLHDEIRACHRQNGQHDSEQDGLRSDRCESYQQKK
jgi:hypothetical protein